MRVLGGIAAVLGATCIAVAVSIAPASAAQPGELDGFEYVALGDSYSAGYGLVPFSATSPFTATPSTDPNGCYQADANYPHLVATQLGLGIDDQTCSGAISSNIGFGTGVTITAPPVINTLPTLPTGSVVQTTATGQIAPQLQSAGLSATTDIVTVAIGGNDLGFADIAEACIRLTNGPGTDVTGLQILASVTVANCQDYFDDATTYPDAYLQTRLATYVVPRINAVMAEIKAAAPNAQVFVVGYPQIAPSDPTVADGCFTSPLPPATETVPFSGTDLLFIHEIEIQLDAALQSAAAAQGFHFVSTAASTAANTLCSADPWISGLTVAYPAGGICPVNTMPLGHDGNVYVCVTLGALHPNASGVANLAAVVGAALPTAFAMQLTGGSPEPGGTISFSGSGYQPGEQVSVVLHSFPSALGSFTASASGAFSGSAVIPGDVPPGAHTLTGTGLTSGRAFSAAVSVTLPATGLDVGPWLTLAGVLLLAGGALLFSARRPRRSAPAR
jgi:LPXTG-motif cell wall-anchored protein